jgi:hypothetical protein
MNMTRTLLLLAAALAGCTGSGGNAGVADTCFDARGTKYSPCRVFRGRLQLPQAAQLHSFSRYFQIAAVGFVADKNAPPPPPAADGAVATSAMAGDGGAADTGATPDAGTADSAPDTGPGAQPTDRAAPRFFYGSPFAHEAGAGQRPDVPFAIVVPCEMTLNLVLQVPRGSAAGTPGLMVAAMQFPDEDGGSALTTLVPRQAKDACGAKTNQHDLEKVVLELETPGVLSTGRITLGKDTSKNPLSLVDTDIDGTDNLADTDDDDDGNPDLTDGDVDGDGVLDKVQTLSALPDEDKDGVPDAFE